MAIALYPYTIYTVYINGGSIPIIQNSIKQADFCAVSLQFSTPSAIVGATCIEVVSYVTNSPRPQVNQMAIDPQQATQTMSFVTDGPVLLMTTRAWSTMVQDTGYIVNIMFGSLVQGSNELTSTSDTTTSSSSSSSSGKAVQPFHQCVVDLVAKLKAYPCICNNCFKQRLLQLNRPELTMTSGASQSLPTTTFSFTFNGKNLMYLPQCLTNWPMIRLIKRATLEQNGQVVVASTISLSSAFKMAMLFDTSLTTVTFVGGTATLTIYPTNETYTPLTFAITMIDTTATDDTTSLSSSSSLTLNRFGRKRFAK